VDLFSWVKITAKRKCGKAIVGYETFSFRARPDPRAYHEIWGKYYPVFWILDWLPQDQTAGGEVFAEKPKFQEWLWAWWWMLS
jgi:hypothetical protein